MMNILYFASIRENIGISSETISCSSNIDTVNDLLTFLRTKGNNYKGAFSQTDLIRVAINNEYVGLDKKVHSADEIAFFPPMTGG